MGQYFYLTYKCLGIICREQLGQPFWIIFQIYYYILSRARLELDLRNSYWKRKIRNFATNNIQFFTHQTQSDIGKLGLPNLIALLTASQIIEASFHTFLTRSLLRYKKISLSPVSYSKCFSGPSPVYHKTSPILASQSEYFTSLTPIYNKINRSRVRYLSIFRV